jgi:diguanylate cyclase
VTSFLVLDDRPARELLRVVLGYAGYEAPSGHIALTLARDEQPDLIIADLLLPQVDGYQFVQELRRDPEVSAIPVISTRRPTSSTR